MLSSSVVVAISFAVGSAALSQRAADLLPKEGLGQSVGGFTIYEDGTPQTRYAVTQQPSQVSVSGDSITLKYGGGSFVAKYESNGFSADMYQEYQLFGKTFALDVELGSISCSCNVAMTVVAMPGYNYNGQPDPCQYGTYYCDANKVGGNYCQEMDLMEANKYVTQITPHKCNGNAGSYISWCDGGGCATNSYKVNSKGMCPDGSCIINTSQKYRLAISFGEGSISARVTQGSQTFQFNVCNDYGYIEEMKQALQYGMGIAMVYWGDSWNDMAWLDGDTGCGGDCDKNGWVTFSNITIS